MVVCRPTAVILSSGQGWGQSSDPATISLRGGTLRRRVDLGLAVRDTGHVTAGDYHPGWFLGNVTVLNSNKDGFLCSTLCLPS